MEKVAVVTGAGSGIGRAVSLALAGGGYAVVLAGRRKAALEETSTLSGPRTLAVPTDVADEASVDALFDAAVKKFGRVDVLFNNAGVNAPVAALDAITLKQWNDVIAINLTGSFLCAQAAFRVMKAQDPKGGRIINNGSLSAHMPRPFSAAYVASKHAITGLTKSLALEGRPFHIACGQIDIGNAATAMTADMDSGVFQADGSLKPEPRMDMRHVADAVLYMAGLPLGTNVLSISVMATNMPYVGRG